MTEREKKDEQFFDDFSDSLVELGEKHPPKNAQQLGIIMGLFTLAAGASAGSLIRDYNRDDSVILGVVMEMYMKGKNQKPEDSE